MFGVYTQYTYHRKPVLGTRCSVAKTGTMTTSDPLEARPVAPSPPIPTIHRPLALPGGNSLHWRHRLPLSRLQPSKRSTGFRLRPKTGTLLVPEYWVPTNEATGYWLPANTRERLLPEHQLPLATKGTGLRMPRQ